jgi:hypothetical protein
MAMAMGLIKTGLKAAVAVKVGHMVHDRIQRRRQPADGRKQARRKSFPGRDSAGRGARDAGLSDAWRGRGARYGSARR